MTRGTGIGGIFLKARDPDALRAWYRDHLGVTYGTFGWVMDVEGNRVELWEPPPGRFPG